MIIKTGIKLSIVCTTLLLSACDSFENVSLKKICNEHSEICDDLLPIIDCRFKRTDVVRARYYDKIDPTESHKVALLNELDEYQSCLELSLFLQFTRNKERKEHRLSNYLKTQSLIKEELEATKGTKDPLLAYYLWTHYQDLQARQVFLKAANEDDVQDPRLLFKLAMVKSKEAPQQALDLYYKALRMSDYIEQIPHSNFSYIMTLFYQHKQFEQAYIWALIIEEEDEKDEIPINLKLILNKGLIGGEQLITNEDELKGIAEKYHKQLKAGIFNQTAPKLE